jgi:hypothetical protein
MNEADAMAVAIRFAREKGYEVTTGDMRATMVGGEWHVTLRLGPSGAKRRPGDFLTLHVDDRSRAVTRIIPGK